MSVFVQVLPVAIKSVLDKNVRVAIIKMCRVFQKLCEKEVRFADKSDMMMNMVIATCMFEKEFPPTFERHVAYSRAFGATIIHLWTGALSLDVSH